MRISVIIPSYNEAAFIGGTVGALRDTDILEAIVADGGSSDNTRKLAEDAGAAVIPTEPGRAVQMNEAARAAAGEILLFLHADTLLPDGFEAVVRSTLNAPGVTAGAFSLRIDSPRASLRIVEKLTALRCRLFSLPYGDQAIFLTKEVFHKHGGWPVMPIMEDYEFMRRLRKAGRIVVVPDTVTTSARRWERLGALRTTLVNQAVILGYALGISPVRLQEWYDRDKGVK